MPDGFLELQLLLCGVLPYLMITLSAKWRMPSDDDEHDDAGAPHIALGIEPIVQCLWRHVVGCTSGILGIMYLIDHQ